IAPHDRCGRRVGDSQCRTVRERPFAPQRLGGRMSLMVRAMLALAVLCGAAGDFAAQFRSPSVAVYIPAGIGGGYDAYARLAARHLGRFLPGNPAIVPKNMPGAGGVVLANYLYNVAPKDGSAIALFRGGTPFEPLFGNSQTKFDVNRLNWLVSLN